jgi:hypothetical protein
MSGESLAGAGGSREKPGESSAGVGGSTEKLPMPLAGRRERLAGSLTDGASIATVYSNVAWADVNARIRATIAARATTRCLICGLQVQNHWVSVPNPSAAESPPAAARGPSL